MDKNANLSATNTDNTSSPADDQSRTLDSATSAEAAEAAAKIEALMRGMHTKDIAPDYSFLAPAQATDELGRLGEYRVLQLLGEGGMGFVFRGEDTTLKRTVALKVMRPEVAKKPQAAERFLREGRAAAGLKSDHIITIYQVGQANGVPFMALEYLEGLPLDAWFKRQVPPIQLPAVLRIVRDTLRGLAVAHEKGLIHRDIKPANLWLEQETSRVKVLDFGLTRNQDSNDQVTADGAIVGTPAYMAPEQASGKAVDPRADLFSVGAVMYQLLAGHNPFSRDNVMATLGAVCFDVPPTIRTLRPDVPAEYAAFLDRLLAKDPTGRPMNAKAALAELAAIERKLHDTNRTAIVTPVTPRTPNFPAPIVAPLAEVAEPVWDNIDAVDTNVDPLPVPARSSKSSTERSPKKPPTSNRQSSNKLVLVAGALFGLFAIAAGVVIIITNKDGSKTKIEVPDGSTVEVQDKGKTVAKVEPKPKVNPKQDAIAIAPPGPWTPKVIPVGESPFDKLDANTIPKDERFPWQPKELVAVIGSHTRRMGNSVWATAISPDGKIAATGGIGSQAIMLWDMATQKLLRALPASDGSQNYVTGLHFADNQTLVTSSHNNTRHLSLAEAEPKWLPITAQGKTDTNWQHERGHFPFMLEGGKTLLLLDGKTVSLYEWNNGQPKLTVDRFATSRLPHVAVAANQLVYTDKDNKLHRVTIKQAQMVGDEVLPIDFKPNEFSADVSGDGKKLAVMRDGRFELWELGTPPKMRWQIAADYNLNIRFDARFQLSPDGRWLSAICNATGLWRVDGDEPKFAGWLDLTGKAGPAAAVAFSADRNSVVVGCESGLVRFWDVSELQPKELSPFDPNTAFLTPSLHMRMNTDMPAGRVMLPRYDRVLQVRYQLWDCARPTPNPVPATTTPKARDVLDVHYGKLHALGDNRWLNAHDEGQLEQYVLQGDGWSKSITRAETTLFRSELAPDRSLLVGFDKAEGGKRKLEGWNVAVDPPVKKWAIPLDKDPVQQNLTRHIWFAGDARLLATYEPIAGTNDANILLWRNMGEKPELAAKLPFVDGNGQYWNRPFCMALAPDGRSLCSIRKSKHHIVMDDLSGPQPKEVGLIWDSTQGEIRGMEYSPNGRYLAWCADLGAGVIDLSTRKHVWQWHSAPGAVLDVRWSDDGRHLLLHNNNKTIYVVRLSPDLIATDADRKAAEYVLANGGEVFVNGELLRNKEALPKEPFVLHGAFFNDEKIRLTQLALLRPCRSLKQLRIRDNGLTDDDLANFKDCTELWSLGLLAPLVGDAGFAHFKNCKNLLEISIEQSNITDTSYAMLGNYPQLAVLNIYGAKVTDRGLASLKDCPQLNRLFLNNTPVTDELFDTLKGCKKLEALAVPGTKITGAKLALLKDCPNLKGLDVSFNAAITDDALEQLKPLVSLEDLQIVNTKVTLPKLEELAKSLPRCRITYADGKTIEPRITPEADRKAAAWIITAGGQVALNEANDFHPANTPLPAEPFKMTHAYLRDVKMTPEGLALLKACGHITALNVSNTNLTDEQFEAFAGYTNLRELHVDGPNLTDACFTHFKNCKKLNVLGIAGQRDRNGQQFTDKCLEPFKDCRGWLHLQFSEFRLTDTGFAHLQDFSKLQSLGLVGTRVTDKSLARLQDAKELGSINLNASDLITDAGLASLKDCKGLRKIGLGNTSIGDDGLKHLAGLPNLVHLDLGNSKGTDEGLLHLKANWPKWEYLQLPNGVTDKTFAEPTFFPQLTTLDIAGAKVTPAQIHAIAKALPKCRIHAPGKVIEPRVK